jgi:hypothetical protein
MRPLTLLTLCGFGLMLIGLGTVLAWGWTIAGGWLAAVGAAILLVAYVLDRLAALRRSARNARRLIR